jgi:hypothetical protein
MERPDAGWFESAGWNVTISRTPAWSLVVSASEVDLDLATVPVESLDVVADGVVRVGSPLGDVAVRIAGSVELSIPTSATVEIIGTASVPNGWTETDTGWFNEGSGTSRFVVTVDDGASLTVRQW